MEQKIVVDISPDGEVRIEAQGFVGCGCTEATRLLEQALGGRVERTLKPEYYLADTQVQQEELRERW